MSTGNVWLITGAGRGLAIHLAQASLAGGHSVVATCRNADRVRAVVGGCGSCRPSKSDPTPYLIPIKENSI
jgi:NAD(P)-dependent dehydrogenase (short-subunit alcohol dehydrogenase family)